MLAIPPLPATELDRIQRAVAQHGYSRYILTDDDGVPSGVPRPTAWTTTWVDSV